MSKSCPSCKSFNARRSSVRTSEVTLRHIFLSPYRCRDCRARFWVVSKNAYYVAAILGGLVAVAVLAWHASALIEEAPGMAADNPPPADRRLSDLLKLAEANDPAAEYDLARMYAIGQGVPKSPRDEQKWLERSARHGNVEAQYEYGMALRDGRGTVQDYEGARKWMQLAAERGNAPAQMALGNIYRTGLGIPIDNVKAYVWLNVAAAQGVPGASASRDSVLPRLSPADLQEAQAEARRLSEISIAKPSAQ